MTLNRTIALLSVSALLLTVSPQSHALSVTEIDDFPAPPPIGVPFNVGTTSVGTNTFSGSLFDQDSRDAFDFTIPAGQVLTGASLTISDHADSSVDDTSVFGFVRDLPSDATSVVLSGDLADNGTLALPVIFGSLPGPAGEYQASIFHSGSIDNAASDWTLTVETAAANIIPTPAALPAGLVMLGVLGLRRRRVPVD